MLYDPKWDREEWEWRPLPSRWKAIWEENKSLIAAVGVAFAVVVLFGEFLNKSFNDEVRWRIITFERSFVQPIPR